MLNRNDIRLLLLITLGVSAFFLFQDQFESNTSMFSTVTGMASLLSLLWPFFQKQERVVTPISENQLEKRYYQQLQAEASKLDLSTIADAFAKENAPIELPQIYQDQYVREESSQTQRQPHEHENKRIALLDAVAQAENNRLVILGKVGSGKSSFVEYLAWAIASSWLGKLSADVDGALNRRPVIRLRLRNVATELKDKTQFNELILQRALEKEIKRLTNEAIPGYYDKLLEQGVILLDGLDEVTLNDGRLTTMLDAIDELARSCQSQARIIVTSRLYAYENHRLQGFKVVELEPMDDQQIEAFIEHWYTLMPSKDVWKNGARGQAADLAAMVLDPRQAHLKALAETPLTLTLITALHYARNILPHSRAKLYEHSVELLLDRWQQNLQVYKDEETKKFEDDEYRALNLPHDALTDLLSEFALEVHKRQQREHQANKEKATDSGAKTYSDISRREILGLFADYLYENHRDDECQPNQLLHFLQFRSAILSATGEQHFSFVHRSFQEYLAARHLSAYEGIDVIETLAKQDSRWWREVFLLYIGIKAESGFNDAMAALRQYVPEYQAGKSIANDDWAITLLSAKAAIEVGLRDKKTKHPNFEKLDSTLRHWLQQQTFFSQLPITERAEAGLCLGQLGDLRETGIGTLIKQGNKLPDIDWVDVPAKGKVFMMGSDDYDDEKPPHSQTMPENYQLSRYPITNAQFAAFIEAGGYRDDCYWSKKGWQYVQEHGLAYPRYWHRLPWNVDNHPVVGVSWFEATAFANWLNEHETRGIVRLPTEREWEFAARGEGSLVYPWGNRWQDGKANSDESGIAHTSCVGLFDQASQSPFGVEDMSGNVWERTHSQWGKDWQKPDFAYPYDENDGREKADENQRFVLRGGSWNYVNWNCRSSFRGRSNPGGRSDDVGFRLLLSLASDS